jgi:hypothetical protein
MRPIAHPALGEVTLPGLLDAILAHAADPTGED